MLAQVFAGIRRVSMAAIVLTLAVFPAVAQVSTANVSGRVLNEESGAYLESAEVRVQGTNLVAYTSRDGRFVIERVPEGRQKLVASYPGLDVREMDIEVGGAGVRNLEIPLTSAAYILSEFRVTGQREGDAVAIAQQRVAANVMNIVSLEGKENSAGGNLANFLQTLPGVMGNLAAGDIIGVSVRGIPPDMTGVTMDGQRLASAVAGFQPVGDRAARVDTISPEFIKEVRLYKASTPDVDPGSLGGGVDIITKSALDFSRRVATYRLAMTKTDYRDTADWHPSLAFTYMDQFGKDDKFGLTLTGSFVREVVNRDVMETGRSQPPPDKGTMGIRMIDDLQLRDRAGVGFKFEYRASENLRFHASANFNYHRFDSLRLDRSFGSVGGTSEALRAADYSVVSRAQIEAGTPARTTTNLLAGTAPGRTDDVIELLRPRISYRTAAEDMWLRNLKLSIGADLKIWGGKLDLLAAHNPTNADYDYSGMIIRRDSAAGSGFGIKIDSTADRRRPVVTQTFGKTVFFGTDFDDWSTDNIYAGPLRTEDTVSVVAANFERPFEGGRISWTLKTGLQYRRQTHMRERYFPIWDYFGPDGVNGRNPATGINDANYDLFRVAGQGYSLFNNQFGHWDVLDWDFARKYFFEINPGLLTSRNRPPEPNREVTEDVAAAYVMGTAKLGPITVLSGVRWERTDIDAIGSASDPREPTQTQTRRESDYTKFFPSVHLRYEPRQNLIARASWSTTSARVQMRSLMPDFSVSYATNPNSTSPGTVNINNTGLKPNYSNNYDAGIEYYFEPAGVISIGGFYKDVKDWINSFRDVIPDGPDNGFGGDFAGFDLSTQQNLNKAKIRGYEVNYVQVLDFLPKPLNELKVNANYTRSKATGSFANGEKTLGNFTPKTYNLGASYPFGRLLVSVTHNWRSDYLYRRGDNPAQAEMIGARSSTGINLQYKAREWATLFVDVRDLEDDESVWYRWFEEDRISTVEHYGRRITVGLTGRF